MTERDFPQPDIPIIRSPFGTGRPASDRLPREEVLPLPEPVLEVLEAADVVERDARRDVLEDTFLPRGLLLLGEDLVERRLVEPRGPREDLREDVLQLVERLAAQGRDDPVGVDGREPRLAEVPLAEDGDRVPHLRLVRQVVVDEEDLLLQVLGQEEARRDHHHELPLPLQLAVGVPELPDDVGPLVEEGGKVLHQEEAGTARLEDDVEGAEGVPRVDRGVREPGPAVHARPDGERNGLLVELLREDGQRPLDAALLPGLDVEEGVGAEEGAADPLGAADGNGTLMRRF